MKVLLCPDKFKGTLSAHEVCQAIVAGIQDIAPDTITITTPLADGGEGTCALLTEIAGGSEVTCQATGPRFDPLVAPYGISGDRQSAFIEMAAASGLMLLRPEERNPLLTTSAGTGDLIADALRRGVRRIILGLGGSATNDAGIGMASALGYRFTDPAGNVLPPTGASLTQLAGIDHAQVHPRLREVEVIALCDVRSPLFGPEGAAHVYGPQKGAGPDDVDLLDRGLRNFSRIVNTTLGISTDFPGAGAAGGTGAGARVFLNAIVQPGTRFMLDVTRLADHLRQVDLVITGEGKLDAQTLTGKVVSEVARLSQQAGKPVIALCGISQLRQKEVASIGLAGVIPLVDQHTNAETAMQHAASLVRQRIRDHLGPYLIR